MNEPNRFQLWYGRDQAPSAKRVLRAGPVEAMLDGCELRYVRFGGVEVVRRLHVLLRDHNWDTIPYEVTDFAVTEGDAGFDLRFAVRHRHRDIDLIWSGHFRGEPDGTLRCTMRGVAGSDFRFNRFGFCVLHPAAESAGRPYRARTPNGPVEGTLPTTIGPQRRTEGLYRPIFPAYDRLAIDVEAGAGGVRFDFTGDLWEMEDQRNWTDNSFKSYSTPLYLGYPFDAVRGREFSQSVTVTFDGPPPPAAPRGGGIRVAVGDDLGRGLPPIGLGTASHGQPLSEREVELLRALRLDHLRADVRPGEPASEEGFRQASAECARLGCRLELAVKLADDDPARLDRLAALLRGGPPVARVLVFHDGDEATGGRWVRLAREKLAAVAGEAVFAGGTDCYFTELNRARPDLAPGDGVAYSINPQVHAFDEISLAQTLSAQGETVRSARALYGDRPLAVTPVTLQPRFNPNATAAAEGAADALPAEVDPRQVSLFLAGWTAGSVKHLAEAGADSLTYFETTGWRGVMETGRGSPMPTVFLSEPGTVFPAYHVFADLAEWTGGRLIACRSDEPFAVDALAVRAGGTVHVLLANLGEEPRTVTLSGLPAGRAAVRRLDADTAVEAIRRPARYRAAAFTVEPVRGGEWAAVLAPYSLTRVDVSAG